MVLNNCVIQASLCNICWFRKQGKKDKQAFRLIFSIILWVDFMICCRIRDDMALSQILFLCFFVHACMWITSAPIDSRKCTSPPSHFQWLYSIMLYPIIYTIDYLLDLKNYTGFQKRQPLHKSFKVLILISIYFIWFIIITEKLRIFPMWKEKRKTLAESVSLFCFS